MGRDKNEKPKKASQSVKVSAKAKTEKAEKAVKPQAPALAAIAKMYDYAAYMDACKDGDFLVQYVRKENTGSAGSNTNSSEALRQASLGGGVSNGGFDANELKGVDPASGKPKLAVVLENPLTSERTFNLVRRAGKLSSEVIEAQGYAMLMLAARMGDERDQRFANDVLEAIGEYHGVSINDLLAKREKKQRGRPSQGKTTNIYKDQSVDVGALAKRLGIVGK